MDALHSEQSQKASAKSPFSCAALQGVYIGLSFSKPSLDAIAVMSLVMLGLSLACSSNHVQDHTPMPVFCFKAQQQCNQWLDLLESSMEAVCLLQLEQHLQQPYICMLALGLLCNLNVDLDICLDQCQQLTGCLGASICSLHRQTDRVAEENAYGLRRTIEQHARIGFSGQLLYLKVVLNKTNFSDAFHKFVVVEQHMS